MKRFCNDYIFVIQRYNDYIKRYITVIKKITIAQSAFYDI